MNFRCQTAASYDLIEFSNSKKHSVLIEGVEGSGKTYLARDYARFLGIQDFQIIEPKVDVIRESIESCLQLTEPIVLCIENLDLGVAGASYTLLKFLEEPKSNLYIVVTVRNINKVPDTIISRSVCTVTSPPIPSDIEEFAKSRDIVKYNGVKNLDIWRCATTFKYADMILNMNSAQLNYFYKLEEVMRFDEPVSNIIWTLGHYEDNSVTPIDIVIGYIIEMSKDEHVKKAGISCMQDLSTGRIASHAVLAKFVLECKYGG